MAEFDDLINYSKDVTRFLFADQTIEDKQNYIKTLIKSKTDSLKKRAANNAGDNHGTKKTSKHPLVQVIEQKIPIPVTAPELSVVLRDSGKTIGQMKLESAQSARALVEPLINSFERKSLSVREKIQPKPHSPWKLYRMISGSGGWVHSLTVDPANMWFASGSRDGLIKVWDLASGKLKITLTGHISGVRGLAISPRHPYLFSCGDDKMVKCWDLEQNQVVRHYHGHLSGVYCLALHPDENLLVTGGRDSVARVWDMRSKNQVHCLARHRDTVGALLCQSNGPEIITGSYDTTIRLWDLKMGKTLHTLTHHKKSVRCLVMKQDGTSFASGAIDNIKHWSFPDGEFIKDFSGHNSIINSLTTNKEEVLVSGADNGTLFLWDWESGYNFQRLASPIQPGSIESEAGILATAFDRSGSRLITGEADKSIKMFREVD